jgi:hypothetical protein
MSYNVSNIATLMDRDSHLIGKKTKEKSLMGGRQGNGVTNRPFSIYYNSNFNPRL